MVVQAVSFGFDGLVCVIGRMALNSCVDFASGVHSLCMRGRWIFNQVLHAEGCSRGGDLGCEQAPIRPHHFWAVAVHEGFA